MLHVLVIFAFPNALGEELGWRGFALPKLQTRCSALLASITLGLFWGLWHIPIWIAQNHAGTSTLSVLWMVLSTVPTAILFTWVYNNTHGSLLPVWLLHASIASTGYFTPALASHTHAIVSWIAAAVIVAVTGPTRLCLCSASIQPQS